VPLILRVRFFYSAAWQLQATSVLAIQRVAYGRRAARRGTRKPGTAEIIGYTAAAGGLAFAGGDALGAVVHNTTGVNFTVTSTVSFPELDLDGAGNAHWALFLLAYHRPSSSFRGYASHSYRGRGSTVASGGDALKLAPGFVVGPTLASGAFSYRNARWYYNSSGSARGPFFDNTTGYLGLRFIGDTGSVGAQYAWVKVSFDYNGSNSLAMNILEWAYDDSGAPIKVGDTGEPTDVPAPATALLALLGLGAMGVQSYRRRREEGLKWLADERDEAAA